MKYINLRELYPDVYKTDTLVEVTEEVFAVIQASDRAEDAYKRRMYRYKAQYSLDCNNGIEKVAVVSAANESAIASEWARYGLATHADVIFGQEVGSKANSIASMLACGYESRKVVMVGDAMGDAQAAAANGVSFVPILPGREAESWRRLQEEALPKLLHGTFSPEYQATLLAQLRSVLHG